MDESPLSRLPAELRLEIYENFLQEVRPLEREGAAVLQTCRQLRHEVIGTYYKNNFRLVTEGDDTASAVAWIRHTPAVCLDQIKKLVTEPLSMDPFATTVPRAMGVKWPTAWRALGQTIQKAGLADRVSVAGVTKIPFDPELEKWAPLPTALVGRAVKDSAYIYASMREEQMREGMDAAREGDEEPQQC